MRGRSRTADGIDVGFFADRDIEGLMRTMVGILHYGKAGVRESLFVGPGGFVKFESTWQVLDDGLRLTTLIPMGR